MRHLGYFVSSLLLLSLFLSGCGSHNQNDCIGQYQNRTECIGSAAAAVAPAARQAVAPQVAVLRGEPREVLQEVLQAALQGGTSGGSGGSGGRFRRLRNAVIGLGPADSLAPDSDNSSAAAFPPGPYQGVVNGGQSRAVAGAKVYVLQVNSGTYGNSSVSLLTSATGNPADAIGHYVLSSEYGGFSIAGNYTCTAGHQVYVYARGGNSGDDGPNSAIGLMASLGTCPESGNFDAAVPFIFVNEVTTVASAYAMAGVATDATHVIASAKPDGVTGIANAADLASTATGFANSTLASNNAPRTKIHTLANILSACINSNSHASASCTTLFSNARSNGASGAIPEDTATAAINIARNPHANIATLYGLQPKLSAPFLPALESAPPDFEISLAPGNSKDSVASLSLHR